MDEKSEDTNARQKKPVDLSGNASDVPPDQPVESSQVTAAGVKSAEKEESWGSFGLFVLKLALVVLIFRSFIFSPFSIPSESMLPRLWNGDYLLAAKWPYGFSKYSMPFNLPVIPGRIFAGEPERGDVVIFKHPIDGSDYIKRVIGLPGDTVAMRSGQLILNGKPIPKVRIDNFVIARSPNTKCAWGAVEDLDAQGAPVCRYTRYRESLPNGTSYTVLDFGRAPNDDFSPRIVPQDRLFLMGDNRDNSLDSRVPAAAGGGIGPVPIDNLVGRATIIMWSTDGGAQWVKPWTWFTAARWDRIGTML